MLCDEPVAGHCPSLREEGGRSGSAPGQPPGHPHATLWPPLHVDLRGSQVPSLCFLGTAPKKTASGLKLHPPPGPCRLCLPIPEPALSSAGPQPGQACGPSPVCTSLPPCYLRAVPLLAQPRLPVPGQLPNPSSLRSPAQPQLCHTHTHTHHKHVDTCAYMHRYPPPAQTQVEACLPPTCPPDTVLCQR